MPELTGTCPIREHTGDGAYVGRCDFATHDYVCPRHGYLSDYPDNDDRDVDVADRRFPAAEPGIFSRLLRRASPRERSDD